MTRFTLGCRDREGIGHSNLGITSTYLQDIDNAEIIETVRAGASR